MGILTSVTGNGYILSIGNLKEGVVVSYNYSSAIDFESDDYGQIDSSIELISNYTVGELKDEIIGDYSDLSLNQEYTEDYGSISSLHFSYDNYGYLNDGAGVYGSLEVYGQASNIRFIQSHIGSGSLFTLSGSAESVAYKPSSTTLFNVEGEATTRYTPSYVGSGSLFTLSGSAESVAYKPSSTTLFNVEGEATTRYTPSHIGSGSLFTLSGSAESVSYVPSIKVLFNVEGEATTRYTSSHIGSGSLFTLSGSAESVSYVPSTKVLFNVEGEATTRYTSSHVGSGSLLISGLASDVRFSTKYLTTGSLFTLGGSAESVAYKPFSTVLFNVEGQAKESITPAPHIGSGNIPVGPKELQIQFDGKGRLVSAYEKTSYSVESTGSIRIQSSAVIDADIGNTGYVLFDVEGEAKTKFSKINTGEGSLFVLSGSAESIAYKPSNKVLFGIGGEAATRYIPEHNGSGILPVSGSADIRFLPDYPGTGSLFTIGGSAESVAYKPFSTVLFNVEGQAKESITPAPHIGSGNLSILGSASNIQYIPEHNGSGTLSVLGSADIRFLPDYLGTGTLFALGSSAESSVYKPNNKVLFNVEGQAKTSFVRNDKGTGFLRIRQKTVILVENEKYVFTGASISISPAPHIGSGKLSISGFTSNVRYIPEHNGSGSIFALGGSSESSLYSPNTKALFNVEGQAKTSFTPSTYKGSGNIELLGTSRNSFSPTAYIGFGSVDIFVRAKESVSQSSYVGIGIASISGYASNVKYIPEHNGFGTLLISGSASNIRFIPSYTGSGSIFGLGGSGQTAIYTYQISQKAFRIFGSTFESFGRTTYIASAFSNLQGESQDQKVDFVPAKQTKVLLI